MAIETSWLIGSAYLPTQNLTIDGNPYTIPAGNYYLYHPTGAISLITTLDNILEDAGVQGHNVVIQKNRHVAVLYDEGWEFLMSWPANNILRDLLGFADDIGQSPPSDVAATISPLLWSPGKTESPQESPFLCLGRTVYDTRFGTAPDGTQVADSHHSQVVNTYTWSHVAAGRFQTPNLGFGGQYVRFFDQVLRRAGKFHLWHRVDEDTNSSDAVDFDLYDSLGPYGYRPTRGGVTWDFQRSAGFTTVNRYNNVSLDCLVVPEWEAP